MSPKIRLILIRISLAILVMAGFKYWQNSNSPASQNSQTSHSTAETLSPESVTDDDSPGQIVSSDQTTPENSPIVIIPENPTPPGELTPEQIQQLVTGYWESEFYGMRYITVRDDGTATVYFQASTLASMVVGSRLKIEYEWYYDEKEQQVVFTIVGGTPRKGLDYVTKTWGHRQRQNVITACRGELQLLDLDGKTKHHWVRLEAIPTDIQNRFSKL